MTEKKSEIEKKFRIISPNGDFVNLADLENFQKIKVSNLENQVPTILDFIRLNLKKILEIEIWGFGRGACASGFEAEIKKTFPNITIKLGDEKLLKRLA